MCFSLLASASQHFVVLFAVLQGKEVATDVRLLPQGTVIFEDISIEQFEGTVLKVIPKVPTKNQVGPA